MFFFKGFSYKAGTTIIFFIVNVPPACIKHRASFSSDVFVTTYLPYTFVICAKISMGRGFLAFSRRITLHGIFSFLIQDFKGHTQLDNCSYRLAALLRLNYEHEELDERA